MGVKNIEEKEGKGTLQKKKERAVHAPSGPQARGYSWEKQRIECL